jgi:hypothetical protein
MRHGKFILHLLLNRTLIRNRRQTPTWRATPSRIRTSRTKWALPQQEHRALKPSTMIRKIQMVCFTTAKTKVKWVMAMKMKQITSMKRSTLMEILQVMMPIEGHTATPMDRQLDLCRESILTCLQK